MAASVDMMVRRHVMLEHTIVPSLQKMFNQLTIRMPRARKFAKFSVVDHRMVVNLPLIRVAMAMHLELLLVVAHGVH
jgi:hypothetical protein